MVAVFAPCVFASRISFLHIEVWCILRRVAALADLLSQLLRGAREGVHLEAVRFVDCPPWWAKGSVSRPYG